MLLEEYRPLNGGGRVRRVLSQSPLFGPLRALTAPGALERRLWGPTGDKSGLWLPRARLGFPLEAQACKLLAVRRCA